MEKKTIFRRTTLLLRAALLLGAVLFVNAPSRAQSSSGFNYYTKAQVEETIGQEVYYYIQFYYQNMVTYLAEFQGDGTETADSLGTKDYFPFAKNIQWKLVATEKRGQFKLQSARGYYVYFDQVPDGDENPNNDIESGQYGTTNDADQATVFDIRNYNEGLTINMAGDLNHGFRRDGGANDPFTKEIRNWGPANGWGQLRFARLKENAAHVISWVYNNNQRYLGWNGNNIIQRNVENLWELEQAPGDGEFYIHKYNGNDDEYLAVNEQVAGQGDPGCGPCVFGAQYAIFKVENIYADRYSRMIYTNHVNGNAIEYFDHGNFPNVGDQVHFWTNPTNNKPALAFAPVDPSFYDQIEQQNEERFFLRFASANGAQNLFITDFGQGQTMKSNADDANRNARTWEIIYLGDPKENKFILRSGLGNYVYLNGNLYQTTTSATQATIFSFRKQQDNGTYSIMPYGQPGQSMNSQFGLDMGANVATYGAKDNGSRIEIISVNPQPRNQYTYMIRFRDLQNDQKRYFTANDADTKVTLEGYKLGASQRWTIQGETNQNFTLLSETGNYADMYRIGVGPNTALNRGNLETQLFTTTNPDDATPFRLDDHEIQWGTFGVAINLPDGNFSEHPESNMLAYLYENDVNDSRIARWDYEIKSRIFFVYDPLPYLHNETAERKITHRESYLKQWAAPDESHGLMSKNSQWMNEDGTQKTNEFLITHYVKIGQLAWCYLPTDFNIHNEMRQYQRWYNLNEPTDISSIINRVNFSEYPDGVATEGYLYQNGFVTGQGLYWPTLQPDPTDANLRDNTYPYPYKRSQRERFGYTHLDTDTFTVAVDVSRYSDMTYKNENDPLSDDLEEPTLTMRWKFEFHDAKEIASKLTAKKANDNTEGGVSAEEADWLEYKEIHFPETNTAANYENAIGGGESGEFLPVFNSFEDYWIFGNDNPDSDDDNQLVQLTADNIQVEVYDPNGTGITVVGNGYRLATPGSIPAVTDNGSFADSRFLRFQYPATNKVNATGPDNAAYLRVYIKNGDNRYQLCQYKIIFDKDGATLPFTQIDRTRDNSEINKARDPRNLRALADAPVAKISFDFPTGQNYKTPASDRNGTYHDYNNDNVLIGLVKEKDSATGTDTEFTGSSPIPLLFDYTNYGFDANRPSWGSYCLTERYYSRWGYENYFRPADDATYGYGQVAEDVTIGPDEGMRAGLMYIDASEQPGEIAQVMFEGDFCIGTKLMCSGWISGANRSNSGNAGGSVILTLKGVDFDGNKTTLYRYCPGQCFEVQYKQAPYAPNEIETDDNKGKVNVHVTDDEATDPRYYARTEGTHNYGQWQQFYFEMTLPDVYKEYWLEVNNNCAFSWGGDFMLDNIEVYALKPNVTAAKSTPLCADKDNPDLELMMLDFNYEGLLATLGLNENATDDIKEALNIVFVDRNKFLTKVKDNLLTYYPEGNDMHNIIKDLELDAIEEQILSGGYQNQGGDAVYPSAFTEALLGAGGAGVFWDMDDPDQKNQDAAFRRFYFHTDWNDANMPEYSIDKVLQKQTAVFKYTDEIGSKRLLVNASYNSDLPWKLNTSYYVMVNVGGEVPANLSGLIALFDLRSPCCNKDIIRLGSPYQIVGIDAEDTDDRYKVCENQVISITANLNAITTSGDVVPVEDLNYDWWKGDIKYKTDGSIDEENSNFPTLSNFYAFERDGVKLSDALIHFRACWPDLQAEPGDLDILKTMTDSLSNTPVLAPKNGTYNGVNVTFTEAELDLLIDLINEGQLVMGHRAVDITAVSYPVPDGQGGAAYYIVACPIHDQQYLDVLQHIHVTDPKLGDAVYICDEPQGLRVALEGHLPSLKAGFVANANGYEGNYNYRNDGSVLSVRMAKYAQFETVKHPEADYPSFLNIAARAAGQELLFLPIRDAQSSESPKLISKADDDNVYLISTSDPDWDKKITKSLKNKKAPMPPIVGKIVNLQGYVDEKQDENRAVIYFLSEGDGAPAQPFDVREGYSYTLKLPYHEDENICEGSILINLKIVPDYEVWTGGAGNTDWNNDENWRRADGNLKPKKKTNDADEMYVADAQNRESPLNGYVSNRSNYRTDMDRLLRKGFAPLYCTHVLLKNTEWGNAPVLYDALDSKYNEALNEYPFPNLRDRDGWESAGNAGEQPATATNILKFDMQVRSHAKWEPVYGELATPSTLFLEKWKEAATPLDGDLFAEMYQPNTCDEIVFQAGTELQNAHLLNYNSAWVEHELNWDRWYLMGSSLQGTIAGDWYAPNGNGKQQTTYYDPVTFGEKYDRYSPAYFQRGWDKAKTVLYQVGADYDITNDPNEGIRGTGRGLDANGNSVTDDYLSRMGYLWLADNKANVAIKGTWGNTYNDVTVDYSTGGFTVKALNNLKTGTGIIGNTGTTVVRLPKEDTMYDYYKYEENGNADGGTDTYILDNDNDGTQGIQTKLGRAKNRGRLKTDLLLPAAQRKDEPTTSYPQYGDRQITLLPIHEKEIKEMTTALNDDATKPVITDTVSAGVSNLGFYLVSNPFQTGLNMDKFFEGNTGLEKKYWIMTANGQMLTVKDDNLQWIQQTGATFVTANAVVAPGQGFFVQATNKNTYNGIVNFNLDMQAQTRFGIVSKSEEYEVVIGSRQVQDSINGRPLYENGVAAYAEDSITQLTNELGLPLVHPFGADGQTVVPDADLVVGEPKYKTIEVGGEILPVTEDIIDTVTINTYKQDKTQPSYPLLSRRRNAGDTRAEGGQQRVAGMTITAQSGSQMSSALLTLSEQSHNEFLPSEDTELFIVDELATAPQVYTLCGQLAMVVNRINSFECIPIGIEGNNNNEFCTLTFNGVEALGQEIMLYDAKEESLTPVENGTSVRVPGSTQNRYFLVSSIDMQKALDEANIVITPQQHSVNVISTTSAPLTSVLIYDLAGRQMVKVNPASTEATIQLPKGTYVVKAATDGNQQVKKVIVE